MILVPREADGMTITPIETLGGEETNEIHLDGVRVPEDALLGTEGGGWTQLMAGLNYERTILAATSLGLAQRAFDDALAYAKERRQFGRPIGSFQAISHRFAELATEIAQVRLLVRWVASLTDEDPQRMLPQEASMAKLAATELAKRCARGRADHGRLRLRERVPDGAPPAHRRRDDDLRRHLGDPEEHHRQDARAVAVADVASRLLEAVRGLNASLDPSRVLVRVCEEAGSAGGRRPRRVFLGDQAGGFRLEAAYGVQGERIGEELRPDGLVEAVLKGGEPGSAGDELAVPIRWGGQLRGALTLSGVREPGPQQLELLETTGSWRRRPAATRAAIRSSRWPRARTRSRAAATSGDA